MRFFLCLVITAIFLTSVGECFVRFPQSVVDAVKEAENTINTKPSSEVVRVGIGNTNFSNYKYKEITVFGTGDTQIYDNGMLIANFAPDKNIRITFDGMFNIYSDESSSPEKVAGPVQITSNYGLLGVAGLKRAGKQALYHGAFELKKCNDGFNLVNMIEVEDYLKGVVPNEMPVAFGLEALKAQSVAARNYVLSPRTKSSPNYDVVDSVASQVYFGANTEKTLSDIAVKETEGVVVLYNWELILAQYSSTAGGYTESFSNVFSDPNTKEFPSKGKPYLIAQPDLISQTPLNKEEDAKEYYKSKPDSYDIRSPYYRWEREWTADELKQALLTTMPAQSATGFVKPAFRKGDTLDDITEINVLKRGESGKIIELEIVTPSQTYKVSKELVIRRLFINKGKALPSANAVFEITQDESNNQIFKVYGGGFGHGAGMSQYGAGFMGSELHKPYDNILQHYYTGITLGTKPVIISSNNAQMTAEQNFFAPDKYAKIIIDNKFGVNQIKADINGREKIFDLPKDLLGHKRYVEIDISNFIQKGRNSIIFSSPDFENSSNKGLRLYVELVKKREDRNWFE